MHGLTNWRSGDVELIVGDVGDPSARPALRGVDRVVHLAAVSASDSRCTRSSATRERTRWRRRRSSSDSSHRRAAKPAGRRLVDVDLRRGRVSLPRPRRVAPGPRPEAQLAARSWECCAPTAAGSSADPRESKPLIPTSVYAVTKRDHEELCLVVGAAYGVSTVALRFFNVYGPGQALSNPYTGVAAIFASRLLNGRPPIDLRGRRAVA